MYKLLINLLSLQSIPGTFRICINLVQLTRSNAFCQSMKPDILPSRKRSLVPINQHVCLLTKYVCAVDSNKKSISECFKYTCMRYRILKNLKTNEECKITFRNFLYSWLTVHHLITRSITIRVGLFI